MSVETVHIHDSRRGRSTSFCFTSSSSGSCHYLLQILSPLPNDPHLRDFSAILRREMIRVSLVTSSKETERGGPGSYLFVFTVLALGVPSIGMLLTTNVTRIYRIQKSAALFCFQPRPTISRKLSKSPDNFCCKCRNNSRDNRLSIYCHTKFSHSLKNLFQA